MAKRETIIPDLDADEEFIGEDFLDEDGSELKGIPIKTGTGIVENAANSIVLSIEPEADSESEGAEDADFGSDNVEDVDLNGADIVYEEVVVESTEGSSGYSSKYDDEDDDYDYDPSDDEDFAPVPPLSRPSAGSGVSRPSAPGRPSAASGGLSGGLSAAPPAPGASRPSAASTGREKAAKPNPDDPWDLSDVDFDSMEFSEGTDSDGSSPDILASLEESADKVLSAIIGEGEAYEKRFKDSLERLTENAFSDMNYLIFKVLYTRRGNPIQDEDSFRKTLMGNKKNIIYNPGADINFNSVDIIEGFSQEESFLLESVAKFKDLKSTPYNGDDKAFHTLLDNYIEEFALVKSAEELKKATTILNSKLQVGRRIYSGVDDAQAYLSTKLSAIIDLKDTTRGKGLVSLGDMTTDARKETRTVANFANIPTLDKNFKGIKSGLLYGIAAPPKGGKTRFCVYLTHNAMVQHKTNVLVWPFEGGIDLFGPLIRAKHYSYSINKGNPDGILKAGINMVDLRDGTLPREQAVLEQKFFQDLANNPNYGRLNFIDNSVFQVETFIDVIDEYVNKTKSEMVVIDYLGLISSMYPNAKKNEVIGDAFFKAANYAHKKKVAIVTPHQYNQEAIKGLSKGDGADMRTAFSGSAEVMRSVDYALTLWASEDMLKNGRMRAESVPTRYSEPFDPIDMNIDLGACYFEEISESVS